MELQITEIKRGDSVWSPFDGIIVLIEIEFSLPLALFPTRSDTQILILRTHFVM